MQKNVDRDQTLHSEASSKRLYTDCQCSLCSVCSHIYEDSTQPAYPRSLIRVFIVRMKKLCILRYPKGAK